MAISPDEYSTNRMKALTGKREGVISDNTP